ncbi:DUF2635 domain-containing protein [Cupriavidus sp. D39]|uniref:DUF2635 domain-containing protein n=1 Tax=Cupriavidus sp. D39 TaxID=2997877 RepID=UPI00226E4B0D|nr:DUF2635 domain-containing protein [Cupriavidus sp. D39]MCY0854338.1 DUF2635 domain-containing protein [Cupriavidus sp. D39]
MFVKPAPGIRLRDPVTKQFIADEGQEVDDFDLFWIRRINDGDAIKVDAPVAAKPAKGAAA